MPTPDQQTPEGQAVSEHLAKHGRLPTPAELNPDVTKMNVVANKELRVALDAQLQKLKSLGASRERAHAITKLQECIMWLGMDLKRLSDENPYPNSYKPENAIVDPTADKLKL